MALPSTSSYNSTRHTHLVGVALVAISSLVFSSAGIFTKSVVADAWSVIFWRGASAAALALAYLILRGGVRDEYKRFGWPAIWATLLSASGTAAFIPAFKLTSVANVALIWATAPLIAAVLAWATIGERPTRRSILASVMALGGVAVTVQGSVGTGTLVGDALAIWMTLMMAGVIVIYRRYPDTPTVLPAALSSIILLPPACVMTTPLATLPSEVLILILFGLVFAVASITLTEGARRIPAAQCALIGALETPLAPVWAFLFLSEWPTHQALAGGTVILFAILYSQRSAAPNPRDR